MDRITLHPIRSLESRRTISTLLPPRPFGPPLLFQEGSCSSLSSNLFTPSVTAPTVTAPGFRLVRRHRLHALGDLHSHHVECAFENFSHHLHDREIEHPTFQISLREDSIPVIKEIELLRQRERIFRQR